MSRPWCLAALALLLAAIRTSGHHAFASEYDERKLVTISGTVADLKWTNPHAWMHVEGRDQSGKVTLWSFEMGSPGGLVSRGWKKTELKKGDKVTVDGYHAKSGKDVANARMVTLPDGRRLFGGFQSTPRTPVQ